MKIVITGGGSGGHFYPLISVADQIREISEEKKILTPQILYLATEPYDSDLLFRNDIEFVKIYAGKLRKNSFFRNILDIFKNIWAVADTFIKMLQIYPDVVFTNGGYVAFPVVFSARILKIPVVIHVSDTVPSRVLLYAGKFADRISIAFPEAGKYFKNKKVVLIGNPIRDEIKKKQKEGAYEFFNLDFHLPVIWVLGGSQGSAVINNVILDALPKLVQKYQIIHQTGKKNFEYIYGTSGVVLLNNPLKKRYKIFPYMDDLAIKMAAGISDLVIMRAGAGSVNEVANWGLPSILIPISAKVSRDQESNSFAYARSGAGIVIRQKNLKPSILLYEIDRIFQTENLRTEMSKSAKEFFKPGAEKKIAESLLDIVLSHQK